MTDFEGKPTKTKKEEKVEPATESVVEPAPAETPTEEPATIETPEQDAALDITAEPIDKKAFYKEFREWMGEDGVKAKKALAIFSKHGVTRPSSDSLTDPGNAEEYQAGIAYTEGVMKASNAIVKACEIVEPTKKQKAEPKAEEAETKNKKVKATTKKSKSKEEPAPVVEVEPAPVEAKEAEDLFAMFGD